MAPYVDHADVNGGGPHWRPMRRPTSTAARWTASSARPSPASKGCLDPDRPGVHQLGHARRDGLPHRERHPQLLDLRQGLRPPGPHVRAERLVEPARPTCSWSRSGRPTAPRTTTRRAASTPCRPGRPSGRRTRRPSTAASRAQERRRQPKRGIKRQVAGQPIYAWTDLTYLLHKHHVSWGYYVVSGTEPDCENPTPPRPARRSRRTPTRPGIWNPLPWFDTVQADHQLGNIQDVDKLLRRGQGRARCRRSRGSCPRAR